MQRETVFKLNEVTVVLCDRLTQKVAIEADSTFHIGHKDQRIYELQAHYGCSRCLRRL